MRSGHGGKLSSRKTDQLPMIVWEQIPIHAAPKVFIIGKNILADAIIFGFDGLLRVNLINVGSEGGDWEHKQ
jgi:hypothetical protein